MLPSPLLIAGSIVGSVILLVLLSPLFGDQVYMAQDINAYYLPVRWFYRDCLRAAQPFDWFPYWFNGFHLQGEGQGGLYHPLNLLLYRLLPLTLAFNLEVVRSYLALWLGSYLFLRRWSLTREASLLGALFVAFSGSSLHHYFMLNVMAGYAHLPWLLLCIDVVIRSDDRRRVALATVGLGLLTGSQLLVSHPQSVWMTGIVELAYVALMLRSRPRTEVLLRLGFALTLGIAIGAVQLLPTLEMLGDSMRTAADLSSRGTLGALSPLDTVQLFAPYLIKRGAIGTAPAGLPILQGDLSIYAGSLVPVLIAWLALRRDVARQHLPLLIAAAALACLSLLLAMGDAGGIFRIQKAIPIIGLFRTPARYGLLLHFALGIVVAIAFDQLMRIRRSHQTLPDRRSLGLFAVPALSMLLAAGIYLGHDSLRLPKLAHGGWFFVGPLLVTTSVVLVLWCERSGLVAPVVLLLFALADIGYYGLSFSQSHARANPEQFARGLTRPPDYHDDLRLLSGHSALSMDGVRLALGWGALLPRHLQRMLAPESAEDQAVAAVFTRLSSVGWSSAGAARQLDDPLPRARLVDTAIVSDEPLAASVDIDLATTAVTDRPLALLSGERGAARLIAEHPGTLRLSVEAPSRQLLVVSESHHEGWRAFVDGRPAEVVPAHGQLIGVVVEPGRHEVELRFSPSSTRVGRSVSLAGVLALLCWGGWDWRRAGAGVKEAAA